MDLKDDAKQDSDERNSNERCLRKCCSGCHATRTPLWRGGPEGPKSLCNACGIKYNKKRRKLMGLDSARSTHKKKKLTSESCGNGVREVLKTRSMASGSEVVSRSSRKLLSKLREEEQAAILLMALSYGSVYALMKS